MRWRSHGRNSVPPPRASPGAVAALVGCRGTRGQRRNALRPSRRGTSLPLQPRRKCGISPRKCDKSTQGSSFHDTPRRRCGHERSPRHRPLRAPQWHHLVNDPPGIGHNLAPRMSTIRPFCAGHSVSYLRLVSWACASSPNANELSLAQTQASGRPCRG